MTDESDHTGPDDVADFNVVVADHAARQARERARLAAEAAELAREEAERAASEAQRQRQAALEAEGGHGDPAGDPRQAVAEVSEQVIAAMRAINQAHHAHVESLELEAARRCELAIAQAELDAELIRLHARREAHAIISAARLRAGDAESDPAADPDELGEIGETFSRFAEAIEVTMTPDGQEESRSS